MTSTASHIIDNIKTAKTAYQGESLGSRLSKMISKEILEKIKRLALPSIHFKLAIRLLNDLRLFSSRPVDIEQVEDELLEVSENLEKTKDDLKVKNIDIIEHLDNALAGAGRVLNYIKSIKRSLEKQKDTSITLLNKLLKKLNNLESEGDTISDEYFEHKPEYHREMQDVKQVVKQDLVAA